VTTTGKYEVLWPGHVNAMNQSDFLLCRIIILRYNNICYYSSRQVISADKSCLCFIFPEPKATYNFISPSCNNNFVILQINIIIITLINDLYVFNNFLQHNTSPSHQITAIMTS
jgi:hypothetical protein